MAKKLNGLFRAWMKMPQADPAASPIIWGQCIVHLGNPEFSGRVLHTSGVIEIGHYKSVTIAETRNHLYALLGPELEIPVNKNFDPITFIEQRENLSAATDTYASAAINADPDCPKCRGTGVYRFSKRTLAICNQCCNHRQGWWPLEGGYGPNNGRWACKAGCGKIIDTPELELEFLPRVLT